MSKVLIKAQTTLDEYGAKLPPISPKPISPEEQEFNFDRAVDASSAPSLNDIYNQPYDSHFAGEAIDTNVNDARMKIIEDLLQGNNRQYPNHTDALRNTLEYYKGRNRRKYNSDALPESLRQYFNRQSKLPEHMPTLHTPNWQMEDGSIRPGSIPPINAVRRMGTRDIDLMMQGAGLLPVYNEGVHEFERNMIDDPKYRFNLDREGETKTMDSIDGPKEVSPNELGFFVSPNNKIDTGRAEMDDGWERFGHKIPKGYVGIRGLNTKDDKLQMRPPIGNTMEKNTEGLVQSRIPPSRLVPIKNRGSYPNRSNILYGSDEKQRFGHGEPMSDNYRNQVDSVFNEYPEVWNDVNMPKPLRVGDAKSLHKVMGSNLYENSTPLSWGDSGRENPMVGVTPRAIENVLRKPGGTHLWDFNRIMNRHLESLKHNKPVKKADVAVDSSREAPATLVELQNGDYAGKPEACTLCGGSPVVAGGRWKNPLGNIDYTHHLCEPCADQYDIEHNSDWYRGEDMFIGDVLVKAAQTMKQGGLSMEDLVAIRLVNQNHKSTFSNAAPFLRNRLQEGSNMHHEARLQNDIINNRDSERVTIPGVYDNRYDLREHTSLPNMKGSFGSPATRQGVAAGDVNYRDALMYGIWDKDRDKALPDFQRTVAQGARIGSQGEGYKYGGWNKDQYYQIPLPNHHINPHSLSQYGFWSNAKDDDVAAMVAMRNLHMYAGMTGPQLAEAAFPHVHDFLQQFPDKTTQEVWKPSSINQSSLLEDFDDTKVASEPMSVGDVLVKRQTTLPAFDPMQIESNLQPQNSNIFIAAKPGNQETSNEELSRLSDEMLSELAELKREHGDFTITSATGNAEWNTEPSFMLTNVPDTARQSINDIAARFGQDAIGVSEKDQAGVDFITPQGVTTDSFEGMAFEEDPMYSTDFPTGQRLTFQNGEPMSVGDVLVKERISPEAIAHKLEYDKKYESNPVRVKYREDLNRERRKRHIYGQGGPDMSHTSQHTIVPEDPHTNRARHFKSKGTLL